MKFSSRFFQKKLLIMIIACVFSNTNIFCAQIKKTSSNKNFINSTYNFLTDNFHAVEPGTLYRSRQLSSKKLEYYIKKYQIKSVINLRGVALHEKWWIREAQALAKLRIPFYNIRMSADTLTSKENLKTLLDLYDTIPRPILIHCRGGADRTGEAAAIWKLEQQKLPRHEALKQLSLSYRHIARLHPAKRFLINLWKGRDWLEHEYQPEHYHFTTDSSLQMPHFFIPQNYKDILALREPKNAIIKYC